MKNKLKNHTALAAAVWSMVIMPTMPSYAKMLPHNHHVTNESNLNNAPSDNERWLAEHAKEAATILSENKNAQQLSETAQNYALNAASSAATAKIEKWLSHYGNVKARVGIDKALSLNSSEFDWLVPWYDNDKTVLFTQHSLHRTDSRWQTNNGIGVRQFTDSAMYGINAFYDYDISQSHTRLGLGAEYWMNYLRLSANGYYRLSSWRSADGLNNDYNARPANGWDVNAEGWLPSYPNIGANLKFEQYYGDEVALFGKDKRQQDPFATSVGLNWTPFPLMTLGAEHKMGTSGLSDTQAKIDFTWQFGQNLAQQLDPSQVAALRQLNGNRYDFVNRNNNIVLEYQKKTLITLVLPKVIRGSTGKEFALIQHVNSKYPLDKIVWQAPELTLAGGRVNHSGTALTVKLPSYKTATTAQEQSKANRYRLTAIAYDKQGNASPQAETWIEVTDSGVAPIKPTDVIKTSGGVASDTDINTLTVVIKDTLDRPIANTTVTFMLPAGLELASTASPKLISKKARSHSAAYNSIIKKAQAAKSTAEQQYETTTNDRGEASVHFIAQKAGQFSITATPENGQPIVSKFDFKADTAQAKIDSIQAVDKSVIADGQTTRKIRVHVTDNNGNNIEGQSVDFEATNHATIEKTKETNAQGMAEVAVSSKTIGKSTVTAIVNGKKQTIDIEFVAGTVTVNKNGKDGEFAVVHNITVDTKVKEMMVDEVAEFTVTLHDALGNTLKGINKNDVIVYFNSLLISLSDWQDNGNGSYTATAVMKDPGPGKFNVKIGTVMGETDQDISIQNPLSAANIDKIDITPIEVSTAGHTHTITVTLANRAGQPIPNQGANIYAKIGNDNAIERLFKESDTKGTYTATLKAQKAGSYNVNISVEGSKKTETVKWDVKTGIVDVKDAQANGYGKLDALGVNVTNSAPIGIDDKIKIKIDATDAFGNTLKNINKKEVAIHFDSFPVPPFDWQDNDDGSYIATVTMQEARVGKFHVQIGDVTGETVKDLTIGKFDKIKRVRAVIKKGSEKQIKDKNISEVTVVVKDAEDNVVPYKKITFELPEIPDLATQQASGSLIENAQLVRFMDYDDGIYTTTTNEKGEATIQVVSGHEGTVTIKATPEDGDSIDCDFYYTANASQARIAAAMIIDDESKSVQAIIVILMDNQNLQITGQANKLTAAIAGEEHTIKFEEDTANKGVYTAFLNKKIDTKAVVTYSGARVQTKEAKWVPRMSYDYVE
ncbi:inverse autotransporter beta domain-containing protein [Providencia rettgeri]|nr:inverse autotransporter beta domain-containing protein [Providencia rettgeri]